MSRGWRFSIDRGGTFTDVIGIAPDGRLHVRKVLSERASGGIVAAARHVAEGARAEHAAPADPGLAAVRAILDEHASSAAIASLRVGTTVATNALLERTGDPVLLATTAGLADALEIGDQSRPDLFALHIVRPARLYSTVIEARERVDAQGEVLVPLDRAAFRRDLAAARERGLRAVAIVFLHAWRQPCHEREAAALARELGFEEVSVSHELSPLVRYGARGGTTVLNAYLASSVRRYVRGLERGLAALQADARLELMQSHGGLSAPARFHASSSLLSGPAGGLMGAQAAAGRLGITRLVTFDMGGTSTDVALIDGELPRRHEHSIAGLTIQESMLDVHTIAAGGGSILKLADGRASVGPDSAGADPGPACYGRGGPLTLTDIQVLLGRLRPDTLPKLFGPDGASSIDRGTVEQRFKTLAAEAQNPTTGSAAGSAMRLETLAESYLAVGIAAMANAIRRVSVRQGLDPAELTLFAFGGAAGQHACRVARAAGMRRVLTHPLASVLSAYGIAVANRSALLRASLRQPLDDEGLNAARDRLATLEDRARAELAAGESAASEPAHETAVVRLLELRAGDSETPLAIPLASLAEVERGFRDMHQRRFGFDPSGLDVLIEAVSLEIRTSALEPGELEAPQQHVAPALPSSVQVWFDGWREVPLLASADLRSAVAGPALIVEPHSTLVVEPGWTAHPMAGGEILLEFETSEANEAANPSEPQGMVTPSRIEIFNNLFMHIAEQMGEVLRQTAQSTNIKERLDYSCAVFDAAGNLIANAPHMPVHLGSMGVSVRAILEAHRGRMRRGDAWLLNSPYHGGTHLPDMTVVTPVFVGAARAPTAPAAPDFFVASRAHHADIGGAAPGSMPAFSRRIEEEGVLFEDFQLLEAGRLRAHELEERLLAPPYPARNPRQNLADLRAQLAANARGIAELERAVREHGLSALHAGMQAVQQNAAECVRRAIEQLHAGQFRCEMDGGQIVAVRIDIDRAVRRARIDFTASSGQGAHNFNAPRAVAIAAVLYVFRTLVDRPIPLNEGCLAPLEIVIARRSMLDPLPPAAVAAGNVETSQCIVDALYGALGALAASQGTMNNLTFGDERLQYYETIAGGSGAGPDFDGASAVQTHMTNSRLTDPEILESRFPVLLQEFGIRRGSGGMGRHRGGDGIVRRLKFLLPLSGALLANRRRVPPFGLEGGGAGAAGAARIIRVSGEVETLAAAASFRLEPGDELEILTPGGGGWGGFG